MSAGADDSLAVSRMRTGVQRLAVSHLDNPVGVLTISARLAQLDPQARQDGGRGAQRSRPSPLGNQEPGP
jgi:hypothetical protein